MPKCIYRGEVPPDATKEQWDNIFFWAARMCPGVIGAASSQDSVFSQTFRNGICAVCTAYSNGPVECTQPNDDEKSCPLLQH